MQKKHNLDVNTKDNDGDSIIHTAIASEVYSGKILPILDALGKDFDIDCKDNEGNTLKQALNLYKEEAQKTNETWYERLSKEEKVLSERFEIGNYTLEEIEKQEKNIRIELEKLINKINIKYLKENKDEIFSLKNRLSIIFNKKALLSKKENNFEKIWNKYDELIKHVFNTEIKKLKQQNNINELKSLVPILEEYNYQEEIETINLIIESYYKEVENLRKKITEELTIKLKEKLVEIISKLLEEDKEALLDLIEKTENKIISLISEIDTQNKTLTNIGIEKEYCDLTDLTLKELQNKSKQNKKLIADKKQIIINEKKSKLEKCIEEILALENTSAFDYEELFKVIKESTNSIPNKAQKQKRKK